MGLQDNVELWSRPFLGKPSASEWRGFVQQVAELVQKREYTLVVFDPLAMFNPAKDENDAAQNTEALAPLQLIAETGAAVLLVHHLRKSEAAEGQGARGSNALVGFCDAVLELRRPQGIPLVGRRRSLTAISRFSEAREIVLELTDDGYRSLGSPADADRASRCGTLRLILEQASDPLRVEEIGKAWPESALKPGKTTLRDDLEHGAREGLWLRTGIGKKGDPHRYKAA